MDALQTLLLQVSLPTVHENPGAFVRAFSLWVRVTTTFIQTLVVGTLLLALAPSYTERVIDTVEEHVVPSFLWGLGISVAVFVIVVLLFITLVGIIVAVPLAIVIALFYLVGSALAFLAVGQRLLAAADVRTSRWGHLLVGAVVATVVAAIPFFGGLATFAVSFTGVGAMALLWRR